MASVPEPKRIKTEEGKIRYPVRVESSDDDEDYDQIIHDPPPRPITVEDSKEVKKQEKPIYIRVADDEDINLDDCIPIVIRPMTDLEIAEYRKQVAKSKGFDVEEFEGKLPGGIVPCDIDETIDQLLIDLSKQALQVYNEKEETTFEFDHLIKATHQCVAGTMYYITFAASSSDKSGTFRGKVWKKLANEGSKVMFCEMI